MKIGEVVCPKLTALENIKKELVRIYEETDSMDVRIDIQESKDKDCVLITIYDKELD